jgi:hypothetical protein
MALSQHERAMREVAQYYESEAGKEEVRERLAQRKAKKDRKKMRKLTQKVDFRGLEDPLYRELKRLGLEDWEIRYPWDHWPLRQSELEALKDLAWQSWENQNEGVVESSSTPSVDESLFV